VLDGGSVSAWEGVLFEGRLPGHTEYWEWVYAKGRGFVAAIHL